MSRAAGSRLALVAGSGQLKIRNNWLKTGYTLSHDVFTGVFVDDDSSIVADDPNFEDIAGENFHLRELSGAKDSGSAAWTPMYCCSIRLQTSMFPIPPERADMMTAR